MAECGGKWKMGWLNVGERERVSKWASGGDGKAKWASG